VLLITTLGIISAVLTLLLTPIVRDRIGHLGFLDQPDGIRKKHTTAVPRVGGIAVALSYIATFAICFALPFSYSGAIQDAAHRMWLLAAVISIVFITGVLDDLVGFRPWQKMIGIVAAATLAFEAGIRVDLHLVPGIGQASWLSFVITVLWLTGCANAFNLIDGMDGLASGAGMIATLAMLIAGLLHGNIPLIIATAPLAGCLFGFLRYNFNPASVFLGDGGSLLIGFLLGCYGALWSESAVTWVALMVPVIAVAVPVLDVSLSIARRFVRGRPIFGADRGHIHHKLLELGFSPQIAVGLIYVFCILAAIAAVAVSAFENQYAGVFLLLFGIFTWIAVKRLRYLEFAVARDVFLSGKVGRIIDAETKLSHLREQLLASERVMDCWAAILGGSRQFGFGGVRMYMDGLVLEEHGAECRGTWQLRVPLPGGEYVNFFRDFDRNVDPVVLSAFAACVETALTDRFKRKHTLAGVIAGRVYTTAVTSGTAPAPSAP